MLKKMPLMRSDKEIVISQKKKYNCLSLTWMRQKEHLPKLWSSTHKYRMFPVRQLISRG